MTILLASLLAQDVPLGTLHEALARDHVHHAYVFAGPEGVGKELAAWGLAQALLCETRAPNAREACGACHSCKRLSDGYTTRLSTHPDLILLERGLYDPKLIGRRTPETQELSVDQVRTLVLARASYAPHEGKARVYLIRRAEELSTSAANALLKTLEEPIAQTYFILLTSKPADLLATIRSRTMRMRFAPLPQSILAALAPKALATDLNTARGSMARLAELTAGAAPEQAAFVRHVLAALDAKSLGPMLEASDELKKWKGAPEALFDPLLLTFADRGRQLATTDPGSAARYATYHGETLHALRKLDRNASPQLVVEALIATLRRL